MFIEWIDDLQVNGKQNHKAVESPGSEARLSQSKSWLLYSWFWGPRQLLSLYVAKSLQSCPTLCDPRDGSPPSSPVPGILQARTLEWVAISSSNAGKWKVKVKSLSHVRLFATPWTAAYQAPPSMGFSRQEYWSGVPLPSPMLASKKGMVMVPILWAVCGFDMLIPISTLNGACHLVAIVIV